MKYFLLRHLVCPLDNEQLDIEIFKAEKNELTVDDRARIQARGDSSDDFGTEIIHGVLINNRKKWLYPVFNTVPRLLLFEHPLLKLFAHKFKNELRSLFGRGYSFPSGPRIPGESNVLASFSNEWTSYGYNEDVYWGQSTKAYNNSLFWTLNNPAFDLKDKLVIEVGIGSGGSANDFSKRFDCNLIGVDLGYSTDVAAQTFRSNPFFHIVQASVFALPFPRQHFDFVYSHGVIHHTYNTLHAFRSLSQFPKQGGRLYVWVYSWKNEQRTAGRRVIMLLERLIRPWCSLLPGWLQTIVLQPIVPLYIFHQNSFQAGKQGMAKYNWREAMHAARDRFTPRFIHRHSESEVEGWFRERNFKDIQSLSSRSIPSYVPPGFYMNTGVEGVKV